MGTRAGLFYHGNIFGSRTCRLSPFQLRIKTFPNRTPFHRVRQLVSTAQIELEDWGMPKSQNIVPNTEYRN